MQIFTYVDSNLALQAQQEIEAQFILKKRGLHSKNLERTKISEEKKKVSYDELKILLPQAFMELKGFVKKSKVFILAILVVCGLSVSIPFLVNTIIIAIEKSNVSLLMETDSFLLDNAMKNFAFSEAENSVEEDGTISDVVTKLQYVESVTYTNYVVKPGDNITKISRKFGLSNISSIISVNNISNDRSLRSGETIKIPSMDGIIYTVKGNDSLASVAGKYGLTKEVLLDVNDLSSSTLKVGQKLFIPGAKLDPNQLKETLGTMFITTIKAKWRLSSPYGSRIDPISGQRRNHTGMDMACPTGTPVYASMAGKVIEVSYNSIYGNYVVISHANGYQTIYAHLSGFNTSKGATVAQGAKIGFVGSTGYSTGPHLHFTVYKNGKLQNPQLLLKK